MNELIGKAVPPYILNINPFANPRIVLLVFLNAHYDIMHIFLSLLLIFYTQFELNYNKLS